MTHCETCHKLLIEYERNTTAFAAAVKHFAENAPTRGSADYKAITKQVENARLEAEHARVALHDHGTTHDLV